MWHYKVYCIDSRDMMLCDITKQVAEHLGFRFDGRNREIKIKQWWKDWRRDIEDRLQNSYFTENKETFYFNIY